MIRVQRQLFELLMVFDQVDLKMLSVEFNSLSSLQNQSDHDEPAVIDSEYFLAWMF
jgi:hypothetical protein